MVFANADINAPISAILDFASSLSDTPFENETSLIALRSFVIPKIISEDDYSLYFGTSLQALVDKAWSGQQAKIQASLQAAVISNSPDAGDFDFRIPPSGILSLEIDNISQVMLQTLPPLLPGVTVQQLNVRYFVPGVQVNFNVPTPVWSWFLNPLGILGNAVKLTTDIEVLVYVAIPSQTDIPWGMKSSAQGQNINVSGGGGALTNWWNSFWVWISGNSGSYPDQDPQYGLLPQDSLTKLASKLQGVSQMGFRNLSIELADGSPGVIAQINLIHPLDDGPRIWSNDVIPDPGTAPPGPVFVINPRLTVTKPELHVGEDFDAVGTDFGYIPSNQLTIFWDDSCSGILVQSQVQFGQVPDQQSIPLTTTTILIDRTVGDGKNTATASSLRPNTIVAFRVRDFDVNGYVTSKWSDWFYLRTSGIFADQITLTLDDTASTVLGTTLVTPEGKIFQQLTMPLSVAPGLYNLIASKAGTKLASTPIRVVPAGTALSPLLQLLDDDKQTILADSNTQFAIRIESERVSHLRGINFTPAGQNTNVSTDVPGTVLANAIPDSNGSFAVDFRWPFDNEGEHFIYATQGSLSARLWVYGEDPPK